jgi:ribonuclease P protein component
MQPGHSFTLTSVPRSLMRAPHEAVRVAALFNFDVQGMSDEADFSAEQLGACAPARLPRAHGDGGRAQRAPRAPRPRPQEAVGVTPDPALQDEGASPPPHRERADVVSASVSTLTKRADFLAANAGKRAPMPGFVLLVRKRDDGDPAMRVGYTVTRKIGNAVVRNRIKRRFRALAQAVLPANGVRGADHVLIGRADGMTREFAQLRADLTKALAKVQR